MTIVRHPLFGRSIRTTTFATASLMLSVCLTACTQRDDAGVSTGDESVAAAPTPAASSAPASKPSPSPMPVAKADVEEAAATPKPAPSKEPSATATPVPVAPAYAKPDVAALEPVIQEQLRQIQAEVAADPKNAGKVGLLGTLYHAYGLQAAAAAQYESAVALEPDEFRWHYLLAQSLLDLNLLADATRQFERAIELRPEYLAAYVALGNVYLRREQFNEALELMQKANKMEKGVPAISYLLGMAHMGLDEPIFAIQYLKPVLEAHPQFGAVRLILAEAFRDLGQTDKADELLKGFRPNNAAPPVRDPVLMSIYHEATGTEAERLKGGAALAIGNYPQAIEHFELALNFSPNDIPSKLGFADALAGVGRYERAEQVLREVLAAEPESHAAQMGLAQLAVVQGDYDKANALVSDLATNGVSSPALLRLKVGIAIAGDDEAAALTALAALSGVEATNASVYFDLAGFYFAAGMIDKALQALQHTIELDPDHAQAYQALGDLAWERGDTMKALDYYREAVQRSSALPRACIRVASHALANQQFDAAQRLLERCNEATPDDLDIADTLARTYALSPNPDVRNAEEAYRLAKFVFGRAGHDSVRALYTLAAAFAERGDFPEAVRRIERAIELSKESDDPNDSVNQDDLNRALEAYTQQRHLYDAAP